MIIARLTLETLALVKIVPLILSGGVGSRLWPVSTNTRPKQFHALAGMRSMFADTLDRVRPSLEVAFSAPMIVSGARHKDVIEAELELSGVLNATLVLEPVARNTAAALAAACLVQMETDPEALLLVLPADHVITKPEALRAACAASSQIASDGRIVTFGILPTSPEAGYGYIQQGTALSDGIYEVAAFREKPDAQTAMEYISSGLYCWNAGIFLFRASALLNELALHAPDILHQTKLAVERATRSANTVLLDEEAFRQVPSNSIDYAVMEATRNSAVVPVDMGWNDVGSFATLWEIAQKDEYQNALTGPTRAFHATGCLVRSDSIPIAVIGVSDIMVIATEQGILVVPRNRAQDVKLAALAFKK